MRRLGQKFHHIQMNRLFRGLKIAKAGEDDHLRIDSHALGSAAGNCTVNLLPRPGPSLLAMIRPPCFSMIMCEIDNPRPVPGAPAPRLAVKKGSKICSKTCGVIPRPLSETV